MLCKRNEREVCRILSFVLAKSRRKITTSCKAIGLSLNQTKFCCHLGEISIHTRSEISFCRNFASTNTALAFRHSGVRYFSGVSSGTNIDFQPRVRVKANKWSLEFRSRRSSSYEQKTNSEYENDKPSSKAPLTLTSKEVRSQKGEILLSTLRRKRWS